MIQPEALKPGDVMAFWHDDGIGGSLGYARVVRLTRHFVVLETEHHGIRRMSKARVPGFFEDVLPPHEWSPWNLEVK